MNNKVNPTAISPYLAGALCRCPSCGKGSLFSGFIDLRKSCESCGLSFDFADAGDGPAVFIILIVGFMIVGGVLYVELTYQPPYWVHGIIWFPLTLILGLGLLRPLKALLVALQYKNKARQGELK